MRKGDASSQREGVSERALAIFQNTDPKYTKTRGNCPSLWWRHSSYIMFCHAHAKYVRGMGIQVDQRKRKEVKEACQRERNCVEDECQMYKCK